MISSSLAGAISVFFFQAEDGIRDTSVTGVQTCALPIWATYTEAMRATCRLFMCTALATLACACGADPPDKELNQAKAALDAAQNAGAVTYEIGRASCRERV